MRVFTNSHAIEAISSKFCEQQQIDTTICKYLYVEQVKTIVEELESLYGESPNTTELHNDLISFFGGCNMDGPSLTNVYLDHKIADYSSTIALTLTMGIIPNQCSYFSKKADASCTVYGDEINKKYARTEETRKDCLEGKVPENQPQQIVNLINNCDYGEIQTMIDSGNNYMEIQDELDENQIKRCPYAWYKLIDYETGTLDLTTTRIVKLNKEKKSKEGGKKKKKGKRKTRKKKIFERRKRGKEKRVVI